MEPGRREVWRDEIRWALWSYRHWGKKIKKDLKRIDQLFADPKVDIFAPVPFANGKSVLRCVFLAIDHNSYHLGEFGILRQTMNLWPRNRKDA